MHSSRRPDAGMPGCSLASGAGCNGGVPDAGCGPVPDPAPIQVLQRPHQPPVPSSWMSALPAWCWWQWTGCGAACVHPSTTQT